MKISKNLDVFYARDDAISIVTTGKEMVLEATDAIILFEWLREQQDELYSVIVQQALSEARRELPE